MGRRLGPYRSGADDCGMTVDEICGNEARGAMAVVVSGLEKESYYCHQVPRCRDDFYVTFTRKAVRISSFSDEAILDAIEAWADAKPELD